MRRAVVSVDGGGVSTFREGAPQVAARQAGAFTVAQALAEGWSPRQVQRRGEARRWRRVVGRGLTAEPAPDDAARLAWAATLTWPEAVVGFRTAARLHGFPIELHGDVEVYARRGRTVVSGLRPHWVPLQRNEITVHAGLPLTSRTRTAVDCLAAVDVEEALDLYAWLTTRQVLSRAELQAQTRSRLGRHGTPQLIRLLQLTRTGAVSAAEHRTHGLLRSACITGWRAGAEVSDRAGVIGVVDILFEAAKLVVEIDGRAAHSGRTAFVRDRRRQNRLVHAGYRVLRFTWWDLVERPEQVIAEIRQALADA